MLSDGGAPAQHFLVSGGSGGIGQAVCERLAQCGYTPVVGYARSREAALAVSERVNGIALELDLAQADSIERAVERLSELPSLAGVILAASPPLAPIPFGKIEEKDLYEQWQVNVLGPQKLLAQLVRRCFRRQKAGSVVGVLTSAMGTDDGPAAAGMGAYVIAKHGLSGLLALLAADYPWLRVRTVRPGFTETKMLAAFDERFLEMQRAQAAFHTPAEVAELIVKKALDA